MRRTAAAAVIVVLALNVVVVAFVVVVPIGSGCTEVLCSFALLLLWRRYNYTL